MIWVGVGTVAFGLMVLFEIRKCHSLQKGKERKNPWFTIGVFLLILAFVMGAIQFGLATGGRLAIGAVILIIGLVFYKKVLAVATEEDGQGYREDRMKTPVSRTGIYNVIRHPGVWSFLLCAIGYGYMVPDGLIMALWFAVLNGGYTWLQDRYYFPIYLEGYEIYREEVPYLFPKRKGR